MRQYNIHLIILAIAIIFPTSVWPLSPQITEYKNWIVEMKGNPKGPFIRVLWYCNDGEILPPVPYACTEHGGGQQHGKLNKKAVILHNNGYWIANLLAGINTKSTLARVDFIDWYNQLLIEKFLIRIDNGWILEKAQFYRGAIQEENERDGARQLLIALIAKPEWIKLHFPALRIGTQLLPHGTDNASVQKVRQLSTSLAEQDPDFITLRAKIHASPDAGDTQLVLNYAANISDHRRQADYIELAHQIQRVYQVPPLLKLLEKNARLFSGGPWLQKLLRDAGKAYSSEDNAENHYAATAKLLADLRDALPKIRNLRVRLRIMDLSLAVEAVNFSNSTQLRNTKEKISRQKRLFWLKNSAIAAYGTGHINQRSLDAILTSINQLKHDQITLDTYLKELNYLARVPGWSMQGLRFQFYQSMIKLAEIEPKANLFIQDILRGSPLLFFSQNLDILSRDGNQSAGVTHKVFDQQVAIGFHALNPGLVRGTLHTQVDIHDLEAFDPKGIYLLPETISELPPIAGIITVGEGNPLSHVQLLARNLGIPNVTINENILEQLQKHDSKTIIMAVSPNGLVELNNDSGQWEEFFNTTTKQMDVVIKPNLEKLNLKIRDIIDLGSLRATDSGRIVGPKAAKLGELHFHYPGKVAKAVAIPFGFFRAAVLDKPYKNTTQTIFEWMVRQYKILHLLDEGSDLRIQATESFRTQAHEIISNTDIGDHYRNELRKSIIKTFGSSDIGVFIRSDTNVEDLPGFTGAGLNLTLFNIVGIDNIFEGLGKVWASPFTTRAFAWRQSLMETPQHVYPAILLMQTVPNAKSGVMVTEDIDSGDKNILSVAVNEGVGGAVDGQSAESLRINIDDGSVRLLATATARFRKVPSAKGGIMKLPVSGSETILTSDEIKQLIQFSKQLPTTFPPIIDDMGNPAPADIEFGFYNGKLQLFQLRPFLQSRKAQNNTYLISMDQALKNNKERMVIMSEELE